MDRFKTYPLAVWPGLNQGRGFEAIKRIQIFVNLCETLSALIFNWLS